MKKLVFAFMVSCAFGALANEWYVDPTNGVDAAAGTETAPRKTLKGAMGIPDLDEGDTIWLLPGEYAEETMGEFNTRRLYVDKKNLRFRSTAGRDRTFIVGQHDGSAGYNGEGAVACVTIDKGATGCVFEGITFRDGAARYREQDDDDSAGGGIRDLSKSCWVIGCRFADCVAYATGGGMIGGNVSGTEFVGCRTSSGSSACAQGLTYAEFCLFRDGTKSALLDYGGTFVNCTFYGNNVKSSQLFYRNTFKLYNCLAYGFTLSCGSKGKSGADPTGYVTITNTFLNIYDGNGSVTVGANSLTNADERTVRFVSPAMGDFRLTDASDAKELGDAAYLDLLPDSFPAGFDRKDVYGNPVTVAAGAIPAGCALEVPHQTGGRVDLSGAFEVKELGFTFANGDYFLPIREDYTYMFRPVTTKHVYAVKGVFGKELNSGKTALVDLAEYFFPLRQKGGWAPVGVRPELVSTNKFSFIDISASNVYYADPVNGSDDYDGSSSNVVDAAANKGPFKTLMGAMAKIDVDSASKILYLMPGTYAEGCTETRPGNGTDKTPYGVRYRVYVGSANLAIVGLEGPEMTFIVGAPHSETQELGPDAIGGVWLKSGTCRCVQGVTITGCRSTDTESMSYTVGGCAFYGGGSSTTHCHDCIISNNTAYCAPVKSFGRMCRCRILNNRSTIYLCTKGDPLSSCVFAGNEITSKTAKYRYFADTTTYGCTFDAKSSGSLGANTYYSLFLNRSQTADLNQSCVDTVPLVADPDAFDYRLGSLSPAVLFGDLSARTAATAYRLTSDVDGNKLEIKDGRMTVGAVHSVPHMPCVVISDGGVADTTVAGGDFGTNVVRSAGEVTLVATRTRPLVGFEVNGETVPATISSYVFTPSADSDAVTSVAPVYGTNWYVSAANGSDAALGGAPLTARQTIRSVSTNAVAGDVIHVAPGVYGEAEGAETVGSYQLKNRVIVPEGVTLVSDGGAAKTFIVGADDPDPARCVYAYANARICGFTLTGGHTLSKDATTDPEPETDDLYAAMVHSPNATVRVEDCIISNNTTFANGLHYGRIIRCLVVDNYTSDPDKGPTATSGRSAAAGYGNYWYGCIIDRIPAAYPIVAANRIESCTLGPTFGKSQFIYTTHGKIYNTVFRGGRTYQVDNATNCLILATISTIGSSADIRATNGDCIYTNTAAMVFDDNYCPVLGSNAGIDAGEVKYASEYLGDRDLYGNPRVSNGKMDIGAVEYDWRGRYKEDLGRHATAVTAASPEVVETDAGTVRIPSGSLVGTLKPGEVQLNFTVTGGTLAVWLGETLVGEFGPSADPQSVKLEPTEANSEFRLAFTSAAEGGCAEIARLKGLAGLLLLVR